MLPAPEQANDECFVKSSKKEKKKRKKKQAEVSHWYRARDLRHDS
jgi:hypothetical protein